MTATTHRHTDWRSAPNNLRLFDGAQLSTHFPLADPFEGEVHDPQSLHKYAYVHGDPVQGIDPTGKFLGFVGGFFSSLNLRARSNSASISTYFFAQNLLYRAASQVTARLVYNAFAFGAGNAALLQMLGPAMGSQVIADSLTELGRALKGLYTGTDEDGQPLTLVGYSMFVLAAGFELFPGESEEVLGVVLRAANESNILTFYRGTTYGAAMEVVADQSFDVQRIRQLQDLVGSQRKGVFITKQQGTARFYADIAGGGSHAGYTRGLGPAVIRIEVPQNKFDDWILQHNISVETLVPNPPLPGQTETFLPFDSVDDFEAFARFMLDE